MVIFSQRRYARKSQFIPNARAIIEANDITAGERQLHAELKGMADRIAELAHMGENTFSFDEILGDGNMKAMMIQAVAEMLDRRSDIEEVRDHYLGITGQADLETYHSNMTRRWALSRHRKHGQFEWTPVAIIFGCLLFTLTAPLYIWSVVE